MSGLRNGVDSVRRTMSTIRSRAVDLVSTLFVIAVVTGWAVFWSAVARIHYLQGDLSSTIFTMVLFVAPAVAGLFWYVGNSLDLDVPSPSIDANVLGS